MTYRQKIPAGLGAPINPGDLTDTDKWIPFTQFLFPDGVKTLVFAPTPEGAGDKVRAILAAGLVFECEMLATGIISLTVGDKRQELDVAIELTPNGPEVLAALARLVESAYKFATAPKAQGDDE